MRLNRQPGGGAIKYTSRNIPLFIYKGSDDNKSGRFLIYDYDDDRLTYISSYLNRILPQFFFIQHSRESRSSGLLARQERGGILAP